MDRENVSGLTLSSVTDPLYPPSSGGRRLGCLPSRAWYGVLLLITVRAFFMNVTIARICAKGTFSPSLIIWLSVRCSPILRSSLCLSTIHAFCLGALYFRPIVLASAQSTACLPLMPDSSSKTSVSIAPHTPIQRILIAVVRSSSSLDVHSPVVLHRMQASTRCTMTRIFSG